MFYTRTGVPVKRFRSARREFAALRGPEHAVELIERLR
jgi:hypothetical protein